MQVHSPIRLAERRSVFAQGDITRAFIFCCAQKRAQHISAASLRMTAFTFLLRFVGIPT
jgi:hypothetical protein